MVEYICSSKCSYLEINFVIIAFCILRFHCAFDFVISFQKCLQTSLFLFTGCHGRDGATWFTSMYFVFQFAPWINSEVRIFQIHANFLVFILIRFLSINIDWAFDEHVCKFSLTLRVSQVLQFMALLCKDGSRERQSLRDHPIRETKLKLQRFVPQCKR